MSGSTLQILNSTATIEAAAAMNLSSTDEASLPSGKEMHQRLNNKHFGEQSKNKEPSASASSKDRHHVESYGWREIQKGERFWYQGERPGGWTGILKKGYVLKLRLKKHRHCNCFRSQPVVYVAEHHPATGAFPMNFKAIDHIARQFIFRQPDFETCVNENFLALNADYDVLEKPLVCYGEIEQFA